MNIEFNDVLTAFEDYREKATKLKQLVDGGSDEWAVYNTRQELDWARESLETRMAFYVTRNGYCASPKPGQQDEFE